MNMTREPISKEVEMPCINTQADGEELEDHNIHNSNSQENTMERNPYTRWIARVAIFLVLVPVVIGCGAAGDIAGPEDFDGTRTTGVKEPTTTYNPSMVNDLVRSEPRLKIALEVVNRLAIGQMGDVDRSGKVQLKDLWQLVNVVHYGGRVSLPLHDVNRDWHVDQLDIATVADLIGMDINRSGTIELDDIIQFADIVFRGVPANLSRHDLNDDRVVDSGDLARMIDTILRLRDASTRPIPGDYNGNGRLDDVDIQLLSEICFSGGLLSRMEHDLNRDGQVDSFDLATLVDAVNVSEPATGPRVSGEPPSSAQS